MYLEFSLTKENGIPLKKNDFVISESYKAVLREESSLWNLRYIRKSGNVENHLKMHRF